MRTETVVMSYEEFYNEMDRIGIPYAPNQKLWNIDENGTMIYLD